MAIEKKETNNGVKYKAIVSISINGVKKRVTKTFGKKSEAQRWEVEQKSIMAHSKEVGHDTKLSINCTFKDYCHVWLDRLVGKVTDGTVVEYRSKIEKKFIPYFGEHTQLSKISGEQCEDLIVYLRNMDLTAKTINLYITLIKQIFKDAIEKEYIKKNPTKKIELLKLNEKDFDYWELEEINHFISKSEKWPYFEFALVALNTGMRIGEVAALRSRDINFESNFIRVSGTIKKGGALGSTKSKKIRMIPMNKRVKKILSRRVDLSNSEDYLFTTEGKVINVSHFTDRYWKPHLYKIGARLIRFHDLRHTFASHFMINDGNVFTLQKILGHADIKETMRYAHLSPSFLQDAIGIVEF